MKPEKNNYTVDPLLFYQCPCCFHKWRGKEYPYCKNCEVKLEYSTHQPTKIDEGWISVEDRPLFTIESNGWVCTEEGDKEFIAAVPYRRESKPNEDFW